MLGVILAVTPNAFFASHTSINTTMEIINDFEDNTIAIDLATVSSITSRSANMHQLHCTSGHSYAVRGTLEVWTKRVRAAKGLPPLTEEEVTPQASENQQPVEVRPAPQSNVQTRPMSSDPGNPAQTRPLGGKKNKRNR